MSAAAAAPMLLPSFGQIASNAVKRGKVLEVCSTRRKREVYVGCVILHLGYICLWENSRNLGAPFSHIMYCNLELGHQSNL